MNRKASSSSLKPILLALVLVTAALAPTEFARAQQSDRQRDAWQRPQEVMDELGVRAGSAVADVGAGWGYFTFHLARRTGPEGKVYAVDLDEKRLRSISRGAQKERLAQIETVRGKENNPRLPADSLDAILVVNAYHEMEAYDAMLQGMYRALKPGGRLGIIEREVSGGKPRAWYRPRHRIPEELVREDAARNGLRFVRNARGFENPRGTRWYFLIFVRPGA